MSAALILDAILVLLVLAVALWTIAARETFPGIAGFVSYGLLLAIVWVRLSSVDVALTEAAIGGGATGVLLLGAAARLADPPRTRAPRIGLRFLAGALCLTITAALAFVILTLPDPAPTLAPLAVAGLPATGVGNPITAVLVAYRGIDTLLEKIVLLLAVIGVWCLTPDDSWGALPAPWGTARQEDAIVLLARLLAPMGVVVGVYIVWVGADDPGGAFQGGTILAAMWLLTIMAGHDGRAGRAAPGHLSAAAPGPHCRTGFVPCGCLRRLCHVGRFPELSAGLCQMADQADRGGIDPLHRRDGWRSGYRPGGAQAMMAEQLYGLCGAGLVGLGLFGLITAELPLRRIVAFNLLGGGAFVVFGVIARRGAAAGLGGDPVPQALIITGVVVGFAATALAVTLVRRLYEETGTTLIDQDELPPETTKPSDATISGGKA